MVERHVCTLTASLVIVMVAGYYALDTENSIAYLWYVRSGAAAIVVASACLYFLTQELGERINAWRKSDPMAGCF